MNWTEVTFNELFLGPQKNGLYKPKEFHGSGTKIVNMGELFAYDFIGPQDMKRLEVDGTELERFGVQNGDLLFARRSLIESGAGKCVIVDGLNEPAVFESSLIRVRLDPRRCNPRFYMYYFRDAPGRSAIKEIITGAAQKGIRGTELAKISVHNPPLPAQRRIASILSAYDDLIENNRRRIEILEEMARLIYREWFVHFRFPGHENVNLIDSPLGKIPEGWRVAELGHLLSALESGKRPKGGAADSGVPSVGAENIMGIGQHEYTKEKYVSEDFFASMKKGKVADKDVLLYKDGAYIGRSSYFRDGFPHTKCCINEHVFILRSNDRITQNLLYSWLKEPSTVSRVRSTNANAAQPGINQKGVKGLPFLLPPSGLIVRFDALVEAIMALIVSLAKRNRVLQNSRDLLLPRLISGELDVSELPIETGADDGNGR